MGKIVIIAECGINHFGDMAVAKELIRQAKKCGADYAKFQLYDVDKVFPDKMIMARGKNWYEDVKPTQLTKDQAKMLFDYGREVGIEVFYSVFDLERVEWCENIGVERYKIGSNQYKNIKLLRRINQTHRPVWVSWTSRELKLKSDAYGYADFLYCVPKYPPELEELHLEEVDFIGYFCGFSDHTVGIEASMIAMSRGARIIEKHFCLTRNRDGCDIPSSITSLSASSALPLAP